jgi:predicted transcriptional regulator
MSFEETPGQKFSRQLDENHVFCLDKQRVREAIDSMFNGMYDYEVPRFAEEYKEQLFKELGL